jgi:hypothetical protein
MLDKKIDSPKLHNETPAKIIDLEKIRFGRIETVKLRISAQITNAIHTSGLGFYKWGIFIRSDKRKYLYDREPVCEDPQERIATYIECRIVSVINEDGDQLSIGNLPRNLQAKLMEQNYALVNDRKIKLPQMLELEDPEVEGQIKKSIVFLPKPLDLTKKKNSLLCKLLNFIKKL